MKNTYFIKCDKVFKQVFNQIFLDLFELVWRHSICSILRKFNIIQKFNFIIIISMRKNPINLNSIENVKKIMIFRKQIFFDVLKINDGDLDVVKINRFHSIFYIKSKLLIDIFHEYNKDLNFLLFRQSSKELCIYIVNEKRLCIRIRTTSR